MFKQKASIYKHTYGTPFQPTDSMNGVAVGSCSADSNVIQCNGKYFAYPAKTAGAVGIVPLTCKGAIPDDTPMLIHEDQVNDIGFSPFKSEQLVITACQDTVARIWNVDELPGDQHKPLVSLSGHTKRLLTAGFHPLASGVVYTVSIDEVKLWDFENKMDLVTLPPVHKGMVTSVSWDYTGGLLTTSCKDKMLRIFDPRSNTMVSQVADHQGTKSGRAMFCGKKDSIFSVGFSKTMDREAALWDVRNMKDRVSVLKLDISPSSPMPFYDCDSNLVFLGGKGDSGIKILEVTDSLAILGEFKHNEPATGMAMLPKSSCDIMKIEVARILKLTPTGKLLPIRFEVQRQNNQYFQDDLFPDTWDEKPTCNQEQWFKGENVNRTLRSLDPSKQ
ncbi:actin binding protein [Tieghemostelium lacteum]|uniref:Coronin n=1 Tax=Tieghemostelium lacteum TaxID=361077 RepID=A0A152A7Q7_TIELA|nr:actin binding protein [Tieghemostelium lacteum]|eukprot:KYR02087.1 actin binding protein [Tieghemostelium lacteum]